MALTLGACADPVEYELAQTDTDESVGGDAGGAEVAPGVEICDDNRDNDDDGDADCLDSDCWVSGSGCAENCADQALNDEDGDSLSNCDDPDCWRVETGCPEICDDPAPASDEDGDGTANCEDVDCYGSDCAEVCDDSAAADEDGDGAANCGDSDCWTPEAGCAEVCEGGFDEDGDGAADCADADCLGEGGGCGEVCDDPASEDEDGDGKANCEDSECWTVELACPEVCDDADGGDEDGDGAANCADSDCWVAGAGCAEVCDDAGEDEDGDEAVDCADSDCWVADTGCAEVCDDAGDDEDADGVADCADSDCWVSDGSCSEVCDDAGDDEDGDGDADCDDADCWVVGGGCGEVCDDAASQDEDGDGKANCEDSECWVLGGSCAEVCDDGDSHDEDGDGAVNCSDDDCWVLDGSCTEVCDTEGNDEDGDTFADCDDSDCWVLGGICSEVCGDRGDHDEDGDGAANCADSDCWTEGGRCSEVCDGEGNDEDGDGAADCADSDCWLPDGICPEVCNDAGGHDEDADGRVNCDDNDCAVDLACLGDCPDLAPLAQLGARVVDRPFYGRFDCDLGSVVCDVCATHVDCQPDGLCFSGTPNFCATPCAETSECPDWAMCFPGANPEPPPEGLCLNADLGDVGPCPADYCGGPAPENPCDGVTCGAGQWCDLSTGTCRDDILQSCQPEPKPERTFLWEAPYTTLYIFDTYGSDFDTLLSLREVCGGGVDREIACNDDVATEPPSNWRSSIAHEFEAGERAIVVLSAYHLVDLAGVHMALNIRPLEDGRCGDGEDNDSDTWVDCDDPDCAVTEPSCLGDVCPNVSIGELLGTTAADTGDRGNDFALSCGGTEAADIAVAWRAPATATYRVTAADTSGGGKGPVVAVLENCVDSEEIACDASFGADTAQVEFRAEAGRSMVFVVDGRTADDAAAWSLVVNAVESEGECADRIDDDLDNKIDCRDEDCWGDACAEDCALPGDEDGDGMADCADPECFGPTCVEICNDLGHDEDTDGQADCLDADCILSEFCRSTLSCPELDMEMALDTDVAVALDSDEVTSYSCGSAGGLGPDATLAWTAPAPGTYNFIVASENTEVGVLAELRGACPDAASVLACGQEDPGSPIVLTADLEAEQTVVLVVDGDAASDWVVRVEAL